MLDLRRRQFLTLLGGAAAAWPIAARAQPAMPMVGWMSGRAPEDSAHLLAAFQEGLRETGFVEKESVTIEYRWARGQYDRLSALAADLADRKVAVIAANGGSRSAFGGER
jgi:putative tryptophan/tyrosine transport system substrate-binding protein